MQKTDAPFNRYIAEAKEKFPTQKKGFNGLATQYRKATSVGQLLISGFIERPGNRIYLGVRDDDEMSIHNMYLDGNEHHSKISVHYCDEDGGDMLGVSTDISKGTGGKGYNILIDSSPFIAEYIDEAFAKHSQQLQYPGNDLIHETAHWIDSSYDIAAHSSSAVFDTLYRQAEQISPGFKKGMGRIRSFNNYIVGTDERELQRENFCILAECCMGQKNAPKWLPEMVNDYYKNVLRLHLEVLARHPESAKALFAELGKSLPKLMGEDFATHMDSLIQQIKAQPEGAAQRKLLERELQGDWSKVFAKISDNVKQSLGKKASDIPSLTSGRPIG